MSRVSSGEHGLVTRLLAVLNIQELCRCCINSNVVIVKQEVVYFGT